MATKVLLVEDDPAIQRLYDNLFRLEGYGVALLPDGNNVVDTAKHEKPDIILMDVMMPGRNGLDALKDLKAERHTKYIPVIMLSAYEEDDLLFQAMQAGANRYLVKSRLEPPEVVAIIKEVIAQQQTGKEDQAQFI